MVDSNISEDSEKVSLYKQQMYNFIKIKKLSLFSDFSFISKFLKHTENRSSDSLFVLTNSRLFFWKLQKKKNENFSNNPKTFGRDGFCAKSATKQYLAVPRSKHSHLLYWCCFTRYTHSSWSQRHWRLHRIDFCSLNTSRRYSSLHEYHFGK